MVMGPLAAWIMKQLDKLWDGKIKPGFEMLVNNFSAGIASALLAVVGLLRLRADLRGDLAARSAPPSTSSSHTDCCPSRR